MVSRKKLQVLMLCLFCGSIWTGAEPARAEGCSVSAEANDPVKDGQRIKGIAVVKLSSGCRQAEGGSGSVERKVCPPLAPCRWESIDYESARIEPGQTRIFYPDGKCAGGKNRYKVVASIGFVYDEGAALEFTC
jgi:hypothetical protein